MARFDGQYFAPFVELTHSRLRFQAVDWVLGCPEDSQDLTNCESLWRHLFANMG